jgi:hypothetical protein
MFCHAWMNTQREQILFCLRTEAMTVCRRERGRVETRR